MTTARVRDLLKMRESNCEADPCQVIATIKFDSDEETFPLTTNVLNEYMDTYFASVLNHPWEDHEKGLIRLSRDVVAFREVYRFITGGVCTILGDDVSLRFILDVKREADFYGVVGMVPLCDQMGFVKLQSWCTKVLPSLNLLRAVHQPQHAKGYNASKYAYLKKIMLRVATKVDLNSEWRGIESSLFPTSMQGAIVLPTNTMTRLFGNFHSSAILPPRRRRWDSIDFCEGAKQQQQLQSILNQLPSLPRIKSYSAHPLVRVINEDEEFTDTFPMYLSGCVGAAYTILHAADEGGEITIHGNGQTRTISKEGEFIAVLAGHSITVSKVTSGRVILLSGVLKNDFLGANSEAVPEVPESIYPELLNAVQSNLQHFSGIALCLTAYYSIFEFDDVLLCGEGSPVFLTDKDAFLHDYLMQHFVVTMVTVYIERQQAECRAGILHSGLNNENVKFIVPPLGYGEVFDGRTRSDFRALVTALYIQVK